MLALQRLKDNMTQEQRDELEARRQRHLHSTSTLLNQLIAQRDDRIIALAQMRAAAAQSSTDEQTKKRFKID